MLSYASGLGSWMTPLHHAALQNKLEAARLLVKHGADPDERGFQDNLKGGLAKTACPNVKQQC